MSLGELFDVQGYAIHDGPGIRTAVFLRRCPLRCAWCHNPEAWAGPPGEATVTDAAELVERILLDRPFFDGSGGGVTFTGGEPTAQAEFLLEALGLLKAEGIHTAIETCGHFNSSLCEPLAKRVDLFLFDLKHADPERHREGTGAGNALILANLARLVELVGTGRIVPRIPIVPGFNESVESVEAMLSLLEALGFAGEVHLMAYHGWARHKYDELGLDFEDRAELDESTRSAISELFCDRALVPVWGGGS